MRQSHGEAQRRCWSLLSGLPNAPTWPYLCQHTHPFSLSPCLGFLLVLFGSRMCSDLLFHMFFLPQFMATAGLSCFPSSESLCRILNTEARGGVKACLALRSGSFQSRGLPLCQAELFVRHRRLVLHRLRLTMAWRARGAAEVLWWFLSWAFWEFKSG